MLEIMRSNRQSLRWILAIVAVSMVGYLGYYFNSNTLGSGVSASSDDWAAKIDEEVISRAEFDQAHEALARNYEQQLQGQFEALRKALRLPEVALNDLINRKLMLRDARARGLSVSPEEISAQIMSFPAFKDANGNFIGKAQYEEMLLANGYTPAMFERDFEEGLLIAKWRALVSAPVVVSDAEIEAAWRTESESASFRYLPVPPGRWSASEPTEAEARAWFDSHTATYRTTEGRRALIAMIAPASAPPVPVSDADLHKAYDDNLASWQRPEQRRARHILFKLEPNADAAADAAAKQKAERLLAELKGGADFAVLATVNSQDPGSAAQGGDLGWFEKGRMVPEFEQAVFGSAMNALTGPVKTAFGYHIIQVTGERPAGTTPFEEAAPALRAQLEARRASDAQADRARQFKTAVTDPAKFEETAKTQGLKVTDSGPLFPGMPIPGIGPDQQLARLIFNTAVGTVSEPEFVSGGTAVVSVTAAVPASEMMFEQTRERVMADLRRDRARDVGASQARQALVAAGGSLDALAKTLNVEVKTAGPIHRGDPMEGLTADRNVENALFSGAPGGSPVVAAARDGSVVIAQITQRTAANPAELASKKDSLRATLLDEKTNLSVTAFVRQLRDNASITPNTRMIEALSS